MRDFIQHEKIASVPQIAGALALSPALVEEIIHHWLRRGYISEHADIPSCLSQCSTGSCRSCPEKKITKNYYWIKTSIH
ncbi:FeoC-like transcriptional regulator [Celerinatantimonas sp. YJH-8]|uniref:FeoC-like transcriptional regulator n=1 Tax=Celerinatantimonas sp. YJH-8 TaxID=3228714 RepID=UPI0038C3DF7B